jgi:hypothetical protein
VTRSGSIPLRPIRYLATEATLFCPDSELSSSAPRAVCVTNDNDERVAGVLCAVDKPADLPTGLLRHRRRVEGELSAVFEVQYKPIFPPQVIQAVERDIRLSTDELESGLASSEMSFDVGDSYRRDIGVDKTLHHCRYLQTAWLRQDRGRVLRAKTLSPQPTRKSVLPGYVLE